MKWQVWVDTGGTFTDCIGVSPGGEVRRAKVLSSGVLRARLLDTGLIDRFGTLPCDFFRGWTIRSGAQKSRVVASHPAGPGTHLDLETSLGITSGDLLELTDGSGPAVIAARLALGTATLPPLDLRVATTIATNALLEGRGERVALLVTRGFRDLLVIGDQTRPHLFDLDIPARVTLCERVIEV
ncbi:MAG: hypothetical protein KDA28_08855, partial [Phycisphaerales bacterium]|nr:hypothetical protein [Phycisphaerales bacterium]